MKIILCAICALSPISPVIAAAVTGTFGGTVYNTIGSKDGASLSPLAGLPVSGGFSWDASALTGLYGTDGTTYRAAYAYSPHIPVRIWGSVLGAPGGDFDFDVTGDAFSEVYAGKDFLPATYPNWLYIQASSSSSFVAFLSPYNMLGAHFLYSVDDLNSVDFSSVDPVSSYGNVNFNTGQFSFGISRMQAVGTGEPIPVPEPSTLSLAMLTAFALLLTRSHRLR